MFPKVEAMRKVYYEERFPDIMCGFPWTLSDRLPSIWLNLALGSRF